MALSTLLAEYNKLLSLEEKKRSLLAAPATVDKAVASIAQEFSPSVAKPKYAKFGTRTEAVAAAVPEDHPMRDFGSTLKQSYQRALADPRLRGMTSAQILTELTPRVLAHRGPKGMDRITGAHLHKMRADTAIGNLFGYFGPDEDVKALPGYERFQQVIRAMPVPKHDTPAAEAFAYGFGGSLAWRGTKKGLARLSTGAIGKWATRGLVAQPHPLGKAVGLGLMLIPEFKVWDWLSNKIEESDWGRVRSGWKKLAASGLVFMGGHTVAQRALLKGVTAGATKGLVAERYAKTLKYFPNARAALLAGARQREGKAIEELFLRRDALAGLRRVTAKKAAYDFASQIEIVDTALRRPPAMEALAEPTLALPEVTGGGRGYVQGRSLLEDISMGRVPLTETVSPGYERMAGLVRPTPTAGPRSTMSLDAVSFGAAEELAPRLREATGLGQAEIARVVREDILGQKRQFIKPVKGYSSRRAFYNLSDEATDYALKEARAEGLDASILKSHNMEADIKTATETPKAVATKAKRTVAPTVITPSEGAAKAAAKSKVKRTAIAASPISRAEVAQKGLEKELVEAGIKPREVPVAVKSLEAELARINKAFETGKVPDRHAVVLQRRRTELEAQIRRATGVQPPTRAGSYILVEPKGDQYRAYILSDQGVKAEVPGLMGTSEEAREAAVGYLSETELDSLATEMAGQEVSFSKARTSYLEATEGTAESVMPTVDELRALTNNPEELFQGKRIGVEGVVEPAKEVGILKPLIFGLVGAVPLLSLLSPREAEASPAAAVETVSKAAVSFLKRVPKNPKQILDYAKKAGLIAHSVDPAKPFKLPARQQQLNVAAFGTESLGSLTKAVKRTKSTPFGVERFMSPHGYANLFYEYGYGPSVQLVSMAQAIQNNEAVSFRVLRNILREVPGIDRAHAKEIVKEMEPLAKRYAADVGAYRAVEIRLGEMEKLLGTLYGSDKQALKRTAGLWEMDKKAAKKIQAMGPEHMAAIEQVEAQLDHLATVRKGLSPVNEAFLRDWETMAKGLSRKYPSTRVALAAEDFPEFKKFPWLEPMLSFEEKAAAGRLRGFHDDIALDMIDAGHDVITAEPYLHHAFHPAWKAEEILGRLEELNVRDVSKALPFTKFHQRGKFSRQMVPDINYVLGEYVPDVHRRMQWSTFWDKGNPEGWFRHSQSPIVQGNDALKKFWERVAQASVPIDMTAGNIWANRYTALETALLLGWNVGTGFKHIFKNQGTWATLGVKESLKHIPESMSLAVRHAVSDPRNKGTFRKLFPRGAVKADYDDMSRMLINQDKYLNIVADLEMIPYDIHPLRQGKLGKFDNWMQRINQRGSVFISGVEAFDRAHSLVAASSMAQKRGMTTQQAVYGIYDTILKNNFYGGVLNPTWARNPKVRALFMFQNTAFKIFERRLVAALQAGKDAKGAWGVIKKQDVGETLSQMLDLKRYIKEGETVFKQNLIADALFESKDVFGTPVTKQFIKEMMIVGATIGGGAMVGLDFGPHSFHAPFLRHGRKDPTLAVSPVVSGWFNAWDQRERAKEMDDETPFFVTSWLQHWFGKRGALPNQMWKILRISKGDIPEIYKGSKLQYLFSVPSKGGH